MLRGKKVTLRAVTREDLPRLMEFRNDLAVEIAGGGDPPTPYPLERLRADFDRETREGDGGKTGFAIEADGKCIGHCGLFEVDETARRCELGIIIGDKEYWGVATDATRWRCCSTTLSGCGTSGGCG